MPRRPPRPSGPPLGSPPRPPLRPPTASSDAIAARLEALEHRRVGGPPPAAAAPAARRRSGRHPASTARAAAIVTSLASTAGLSAYFITSASAAPHQVGAATIVAGQAATPTTGGAPTSSTSPATTAPATPSTGQATPSTTPSTTAAANSVVDGATFQNKWGPVQVKATFGADGRLVSVNTIQTPNDRGRSVEINNNAVPQLDAEAVTAQSAKVDTVSGATYTSTDYQRSLQSAIDAARAANLTNLA